MVTDKYTWLDDEIEILEGGDFTEPQLFRTYKLQKRGNEWCAVSEDGTKTLGSYTTEAQVNVLLSQIHAATAAKG